MFDTQSPVQIALLAYLSDASEECKLAAAREAFRPMAQLLTGVYGASPALTDIFGDLSGSDY